MTADMKEEAIAAAKKAVDELRAMGIETIIIFGRNDDHGRWGTVAMDWDMSLPRAKEILDYAYSELLVN